MLPSLRSRNDVVEILSLPSAVLASVVVTLKHRPAIDGDPTLIRDAYVAPEPDDRW
jgi:hypothetical protein